MCDVVILPSIDILECASTAQHHHGLTHISFQPLIQWAVQWEIKLIGSYSILAQAHCMPFHLLSGPSLKPWESEREVQRG